MYRLGNQRSRQRAAYLLSSVAAAAVMSHCSPRSGGSDRSRIISTPPALHLSTLRSTQDCAGLVHGELGLMSGRLRSSQGGASVMAPPRGSAHALRVERAAGQTYRSGFCGPRDLTTSWARAPARDAQQPQQNFYNTMMHAESSFNQHCNYNAVFTSLKL